LKTNNSIKSLRYTQGVGIVFALIVLLGFALFQHISSDMVKPNVYEKQFGSLEYKLDQSQVFVPLQVIQFPDQEKIELGEKLYFEKRLSTLGVSCATCHDLNNGGTDGKKMGAISTGADDIANTPSIFNVGFNFRQGWRANILDLETQLTVVLENKLRMNSSWPLIIKRLKQDDSYLKSFNSLFSEGISQKTITEAIVAFEKSLITPNSAFDQYLLGDLDALSEEQKSGFKLFKDYGCQSCHQGVNLGGNTLAKLGVFSDPFLNSEVKTKMDEGLMSVTGDENDRRLFKVPSLRNIARTAPYFHDGSQETLEDAVNAMARYQLGREFNHTDTRLIAEFLRSLTGEYKGKPL